MITRRVALGASAGLWFASPSLAAPGAATSDAETALRSLEQRRGGRLGVMILRPRDGASVSHRPDERFPMASTFKLLAAAAVLQRVDRGRERLERRVRFTRKDLVAYSPVTEHHAGGKGLTLHELCHAAITKSDNTAGNLLLAQIGGPAGLTAFARSLGDRLTRLDRIETGLNKATPGDPRDTTTPRAMAGDLNQLVLGDALSPASRNQLGEWLLANSTGDARLRAGLPATWRVGDKTGTGDYGVTNDVAVVWPPGGEPLIITAYFAESVASASDRNAVIAQVGRIAARWQAG